MALKFNNNSVKNVTYNGQAVKKVTLNGTTVVYVKALSKPTNLTLKGATNK